MYREEACPPPPGLDPPSVRSIRKVTFPAFVPPPLGSSMTANLPPKSASRSLPMPVLPKGSSAMSRSSKTTECLLITSLILSPLRRSRGETWANFSSLSSAESDGRKTTEKEEASTVCRQYWDRLRASLMMLTKHTSASLPGSAPRQPSSSVTRSCTAHNSWSWPSIPHPPTEVRGPSSPSADAAGGKIAPARVSFSLSITRLTSSGSPSIARTSLMLSPSTSRSEKSPENSLTPVRFLILSYTLERISDDSRGRRPIESNPSPSSSSYSDPSSSS
mmetsp:Transcript_1301/g.4012  ORF Transcript_1301/g.4012 Transcript_1301/m.4012 type:complete len:276 (-) Transcript_1301:719-1546(-)